MGQKVNPIGMRLQVNRTWEVVGTQIRRIMGIYFWKTSVCVILLGKSVLRQVWLE